MARQPRHRIVTVLVDGMSGLEPAVAHDFLGEDRSDLGVAWYRYTVCSASPSPVRVGGTRVVVDRDLRSLRSADTIVIPGWCSSATRPSPELTAAIRRAYERGARLVSFCTGAFALAEAGVLDGRPATTHWACCAELGRRHPRVRVDPSVLYIDDGQVLTSAGAAASIDLSLHLIRRDFGAEIANTVARSMVVPAHRDGGQAQFVHTPINLHSDGPDLFSAALDWALAHLHEPLTVDTLAARAALSSRQFTRQFRARTGTSPHQWVLTQRTSLARRLLETTDEPVEHVAVAAGFGTGAALRLHFQRALRTSPLAYRRTFRQRLAG